MKYCTFMGLSLYLLFMLNTASFESLLLLNHNHNKLNIGGNCKDLSNFIINYLSKLKSLMDKLNKEALD